MSSQEGDIDEIDMQDDQNVAEMDLNICLNDADPASVLTESL
jgi:hypothetical protein